MQYGIIAFLALLTLIFLAAAIRILREYERGVVYTLGRYTGIKGPGLIILIPFALTPMVSFLYRMANAVIAPDLVAELNLDAAGLGLLTSAFFMGFGLTQLPLGLVGVALGTALLPMLTRHLRAGEQVVRFLQAAIARLQAAETLQARGQCLQYAAAVILAA